MKHSIDRREFVKLSGGLAAGLSMAGLGGRVFGAEATAAAGAPNAEKLGWRLGCQAYSFRMFTFHEAVDKVQSLGLHYIEMYPGQKLSAEQPDVRTNQSMSPEVRKQVKQKLADAGVKLVNFGVTGANRSTFEFAKDMGIETIVSEPAESQFDELEKLCDEFEINLAVHNHPKPSHYWNPDTVLKVCEGRGKRIGACADTGHWVRSGLNPVECLKKLEGRIISFHLKDLNEFGKRGAHDVPWGTGVCDMRAILAEIHRQQIQAVFSIEYEHNWDNSLPEIAQSVAYFDKVAAELGGKR